MTQKMTKRQAEILKAYEANGYSKKATAEKLGVHRSVVQKAIGAIERKGLAPWRIKGAVTPDTRKIGKITTQYGAAGNIEREWVRTEPMMEQLGDFVKDLCQQVKGKSRVKVRAATKAHRDDILGEMAIYDAHIGMYADAEETNDKDYNLDIACNRMITTAEKMAARFDKPHKMVVSFGGDILHSDNRSNKTELSGNVLDVDTRFHKVAHMARRACIDVVEIAAQVSPAVDIVVVEGNHDWHSCIWMAEILDAYFHNNSKINVILQRSARKHMVFGDNLLVWAHGEKLNAEGWQGVVAAEFAPQWGITKHRHLKMGHIHHKKITNGKRVAVPSDIGWQESRGLLVEHLSALCPADAWHSHSGYIGSARAVSGFEYHRKHGLQTRFIQHCD